jgi:hypothetical protein
MAAGLLRACRLNAAACGLQQARAMTSEREAGRAIAKARPAPPPFRPTPCAPGLTRAVRCGALKIRNRNVSGAGASAGG